ncbi:MAG: hypothetical protein EBU88_20415 [Acidobacteria bacterium]|nr:hypothetical protein [Acidobacteriota bacterium]
MVVATGSKNPPSLEPETEAGGSGGITRLAVVESAPTAAGFMNPTTINLIKFPDEAPRLMPVNWTRLPTELFSPQLASTPVQPTLTRLMFPGSWLLIPKPFATLGP